MKATFTIGGLILCAALAGVTTPLRAQLLTNLGGRRAGVSALSFLKIEVSPRAAAMGGAQIAVKGDGYAAQWNPAALADLKRLTVTGANTFWIAGINHAFFTGALPVKRVGVFAVQAVALTTGAMERRTEFQPNGTGEYFYASDAAIGISYAQSLTPMFSYGITLKYINETLDNYTAHTAVADLGFLYRTDFKKLNFAVTLQSFGPNSRISGVAPETPIAPPSRTFGSYPPPTTFSLGASITPLETEKSRLLCALQLNHPNDAAANVRIGIEYSFRDLFFLRGGYKIGVDDEHLPTLGFGLRTRIGKHPLYIDYAADPLQNLGWRQRVGLTLEINRDKRDDAPKENSTPTP